MPNFRNSHFQKEDKCKTFAVRQRSCPPLLLPPPPTHKNVIGFFTTSPLIHLRNETGTGAKMRLAIVSGIVSGDALV